MFKVKLFAIATAMAARGHALAIAMAALYPVFGAFAATTETDAANESTAIPSGEIPPPNSRSSPQSVQASPPPTADQPREIEHVTVTAQKFKEARINLSPKVGTTVYSIQDTLIDAIGQGAATPFDEVLLRMPGVGKDSKASGSLHVRDDHGNVQYRIDGVQLPENISGFGTSIDARYVSKIDFVTGTLPAQYGLRAAGGVEIQTREGRTTPGGQIGLTAGENGTFAPSAQVFGAKGALTYYLSGSYVANNYGIEFPTPERSNPHDKTRQTKTFGNFSYYVDDNTRLGFLFGTYNGRFQIPVNPDQQPAFSLTGVSNVDTG